ncbi:MAG: tetraacyldisaccharide 4'-kinase [Planctomycetota bacterium]|nr:tetraacyldisaccharide 4'-kinase [Planctomycetota bacterium]
MSREKPIVPGVVGRGLARVYGAVVARRNRAFDRGHGVVSFDRACISVGNLSVGGTGKTPMVTWLIAQLRAAGHDPCVAMRGYGAVDGLSDEAAEYRATFEDLPIVAQPDRTGGLIELFGTERGARVDAIVLDDGFQHRKVAREINLALIDATRDPFADELIPAGWLREPVASLARATHAVITRADRVDARTLRELRERVAALVPGPVATARHAWTGLEIFEGPTVRSEPVAALRGRRVLVVCAIGNPRALVAQVREAAGPQTPAPEPILLRDHDPYSSSTVHMIERAALAADVVLTTGKDWAKLGARWTSNVPVAVPRLAMELDAQGEAILAGALGAIRAASAERGAEDHPPDA